MILDEKQINVVITDYDAYIKKAINNVIPNEDNGAPFYLSRKDITQEVRIKLYDLLKNKYSSDVGPVEAFVVGHLPYVIRSVIKSVDDSLKHTTGSYDNDGIRSRRSQARELQKRSIYIDNVDPSELGLTADDSSSDFDMDMDILCSHLEKILNATEFLIFKCIYIHGMNQAEISTEVGMHKSTLSKKINNEILPTVKRAMVDIGFL